ncbi:MAG: EamA family transporter [Chlorobi bacterium]|nr:EamA family transporter [Chlorobiota bacterium]
MKNSSKGYLWSFASIIAVSNVYIFSKAVLNEVHIAQFGLYWFGLGLIWNLIFVIKTCKWSTIANLHRGQYSILAIVGILEVTATTFFFTAIHTIENPSVTSFLGNMSPIFVTILGITILKERFNYIEAIGILLTLTGAFIISYKGSASLSGMFINGTGYIVMSSLIFSFSTIIAKINIKKIPPALLSMNRAFFLLLFSFSMMLVFQKSFIIPSGAMVNIFIGSLLGPFLTVIAGYNALKYIEASRNSILGSSKSLFVVLGAYLYFQMLPKQHQLYGGILTVIGILLISFGKMILREKKN